MALAPGEPRRARGGARRRRDVARCVMPRQTDERRRDGSAKCLSFPESLRFERGRRHGQKTEMRVVTKGRPVIGVGVGQDVTEAVFPGLGTSVEIDSPKSWTEKSPQGAVKMRTNRGKLVMPVERLLLGRRIEVSETEVDFPTQVSRRSGFSGRWRARRSPSHGRPPVPQELSVPFWEMSVRVGTKRTSVSAPKTPTAGSEPRGSREAM